MTTQPMSAAEYWWNHLSENQQRFIVDYYTDRFPNIFHTDVISKAFKHQMNYGWASMDNWPQTKLRII